MVTQVVATGIGGPERLAVVDAAVGEPGEGQVRIGVRAAGTNPIDFKLYSGKRGEPTFPLPLGFEASGVVTAVGAGATGPAGPIAVGDEVIAFQISGAYAAEVVVPADAVVPKPAGMSFEAASGLMLTGATAVHALTAAQVGDGDTVLLHGGAGAVGVTFVQLAVAAGARVVATASEGRHVELRRLGATPITYGDGLLERAREAAPDGYDAAVDCAGTDEALDASVALVADRSRIVTIVAYDRGPGLGITVIGSGPGGDPGTELRKAARLELVRRVEAGELEVTVARAFPLAEAAEAHRQLIDGHSRGKLVLVP